MEEEKKLRILWISDLVCETGFGTVSHNIIKNLKESNKFEITGLGVNYFGDPHNLGIAVFPAMNRPNGNIYGLDRAVQLLMSFQFDLVFILNDAWVISYYLDTFKQNIAKDKIPPIVVYFPVDSLGHDLDWYRDFDIVSRAVTYTEFGRKVINSTVPNLDVKVIPHGIESSDFYKITDKRTPSREILFGDKFRDLGDYEDLFIVLNGNRNQPRKRLAITFAGFSLFARNKPDNVKLYMHSGVTDSSTNLVKQSRRYGVEKRLIISGNVNGIMRLPVERLNIVYNACDVGVNTSMGEGWGLVNVEHAVTGAVQVVPRHSACEELFNDCGLLMETITDYTFDNTETVGRLTTPQELARCLEVLYANPDLRKELSEKGMRKFSQPKYQWKRISEDWEELFLNVIAEKERNDSTISISSNNESINNGDNPDRRETSNI